MNILIRPSILKGIIKAPPSKSYTHRSMICASLARGQSIIDNWLNSDDTLITLGALKNLGVPVSVDRTKLIIKGVNGRYRLKSKRVYMGLKDSGTSLRLLSSVAALTDGEVIITGSDRLSKRPLNPLITALRSLGVKIEYDSGLPIKITGGDFTENEVSVNSNESSQFASSILLVGPYIKNRLALRISGLSSGPYLDITLDVMKNFGVNVEKQDNTFNIPTRGYQGTKMTIEGDYSSASYFLAAKNILGNKIEIKNLNRNSVQGDRKIIDILKILTKDGGRVLDMNNCPDLVPIVAVCASYVKGTTSILNISHLHHKESDRISAVMDCLVKMGIKVSTNGSGITVTGGKLKGSEIETFNDHRIAMSFAIAAIAAESPTVIRNTDVVSKSYPDFWNDFRKLGAQTTYLN